MTDHDHDLETLSPEQLDETYGGDGHHMVLPPDFGGGCPLIPEPQLA